MLIARHSGKFEEACPSGKGYGRLLMLVDIPPFCRLAMERNTSHGLGREVVEIEPKQVLNVDNYCDDPARPPRRVGRWRARPADSRRRPKLLSQS